MKVNNPNDRKFRKNGVLTVYKPEYSPTLICRGISSGIHPLHQSTYIRKINRKASE